MFLPAKKRETYPVSLLFLSIWFALEIGLVYRWDSVESGKRLFASAWILAATAIGIGLAFQVLWTLKGREVVTLNTAANVLQIRRDICGRVFQTRTFDFSNVKNLRVSSFHDTSPFRTSILARVYAIAFESSAGNTYRFGRALDSNELHEIVDTIRARCPALGAG